MDEVMMRYALIGLLALMVAVLSSVPVWGISSRAQRKQSFPMTLVLFMIFGLTALGFLWSVRKGGGLNITNSYSWAVLVVNLATGLIYGVGVRMERLASAGERGVVVQTISVLLMGAWIVFLSSVVFKHAPDPTVRHDPDIVVGRVAELSREITTYGNPHYMHNVSSVFLLRIDKMAGGMLFLSGAGRCLYQLKIGDRVRIQYNLLSGNDSQKYIAGAAASVRCLEILKEGEIPEADLLVPRTNTVCGCI